MDYLITDFGGVLLRTGNGNFAINGGAMPKKLDAAYLREGETLHALILTSEHYHRRHSAASFAERHDIPLIAALLVSAALRELTIGGRAPITFLPPEELEFAGARLNFHFIGGDSIEPVFLTVEADGSRLGIVPDGKLGPASVKPLLECDTVLLGNRLELPKNAPGALARRLRSVSNTEAELDELFRDYGGKLVCF